MIYYFDKYFQKQFRNRDVFSVLLYSTQIQCYFWLVHVSLKDQWEPIQTVLCHNKTTQKIFFNEGKILMISLWLKTVIKRKLALYSWKQTGNPHRQLSTGTKQSRVWQSCCLSTEGPAEEFGSLVVPKGPQAGLFEKAGKSLSHVNVSKRKFLWPSPVHWRKLLSSGSWQPHIFPHPESDVTRKIIPTFSLKQGSPTQAVVSTVY